MFIIYTGVLKCLFLNSLLSVAAIAKDISYGFKIDSIEFRSFHSFVCYFVVLILCFR